MTNILKKTKAIVVTRPSSKNCVFIKLGGTDLNLDNCSKPAINSPHIIRSDFTSYLKTQFMYKMDWEHPISKVTYTHNQILETLNKYKYIDPLNYRALWALCTTSADRETLANLFNYSASTIRRRWDVAINIILFMLIWPELTIEDFKIFPNA